MSPHQKMETHGIIQCSTDISPIKRWVKGQILPELSLQLIQIYIAGVAEPAAETVWRQVSITNPAVSYYDCHVYCSHSISTAWWWLNGFVTLLQSHCTAAIFGIEWTMQTDLSRLEVLRNSLTLIGFFWMLYCVNNPDWPVTTCWMGAGIIRSSMSS